MIMSISSFSHFKMIWDVLIHVGMNKYHLFLSLWMLYNDFMIFLTEIIIIVYCFIIPYKEVFSRHVTANRTKELFFNTF
jgi:hypothetical protein